MDAPVGTESPARRIVLLGAGVVGRSIAAAHLAAGVPIELVDTAAEVLESAVGYLRSLGFYAGPPSEFPTGAIGVALSCDPLPGRWGAQAFGAAQNVLVLESIVERREPKRALLTEVDQHFGDAAIFATNTSSLRLADLESATERPERFCGLHFFMPVERRAMVEVVRGARTSPATLAAAEAHVLRIGKQPLRVADGPGFVVNRMLSPYLNQSMLLLGSGADPQLIGRTAIEFGMPFSPLELVDLIGARTAFDAGRAFWQAFPGRIDPAPVLPGMIKAGLSGRASGCGFYQYDAASGDGPATATLSSAAWQVIQRYRRDEREWSLPEIYEQLTLPMLIEAACLLRDGVVDSTDDVEKAMRGGLDFHSESGFFGSFDALGPAHTAERLQALGTRYKALHAPPQLLEALGTHTSVTAAVIAYAAS